MPFELWTLALGHWTTAPWTLDILPEFFSFLFSLLVQRCLYSFYALTLLSKLAYSVFLKRQSLVTQLDPTESSEVAVWLTSHY